MFTKIVTHFSTKDCIKQLINSNWFITIIAVVFYYVKLGFLSSIYVFDLIDISDKSHTARCLASIVLRPPPPPHTHTRRRRRNDVVKCEILCDPVGYDSIDRRQSQSVVTFFTCSDISEMSRFIAGKYAIARNLSCSLRDWVAEVPISVK